MLNLQMQHLQMLNLHVCLFVEMVQTKQSNLIRKIDCQDLTLLHIVTLWNKVCYANGN